MQTVQNDRTRLTKKNKMTTVQLCDLCMVINSMRSRHWKDRRVNDTFAFEVPVCLKTTNNEKFTFILNKIADVRIPKSLSLRWRNVRRKKNQYKCAFKVIEHSEYIYATKYSNDNFYWMILLMFKYTTNKLILYIFFYMYDIL